MSRQSLYKIIQSVLALSTVTVCSSAAWAQGVATEPSILGDQKVGSVLFFHRYVSNAANSAIADTQINITNTNDTDGIDVHLFFVNSTTCGVENRTITLTPNHTVSLLASTEDPGGQGYLIAVATNQINGRPIRHNFLIGDAYIRENSGARYANLPAVAVAKKTAGTVPANAGGVTANLVFDGVTYDQLPRVVAVSSFNSQVTDATRLFIYSPRSDLTVIPATLPSIGIFTLVYNDLEVVRSTSFSIGCYSQVLLSDLRVLSTLNIFVPSGRSGMIRMYAPSDVPLLGATINVGPSFTGGHNLHHLTLKSSFTIRVPIVL
jgi:hypothetical protein